MKYTGRTSRNINIKALGLLLCILVASYGIIKAPASDTRKLEADLREKQQLMRRRGKKLRVHLLFHRSQHLRYILQFRQIICRQIQAKKRLPRDTLLP